MKENPRARKRIAFLALLLAAAAFGALTLGRYGVSPGIAVKIMLSKLLPLEKTWTAREETVLLAIRLPRVLLACLTGAALSAAGAAFQGVFENPMASPDILGASHGAAFGAALAILAGFSSAGVTLSAFMTGLLSVGAVFLIGRVSPGSRTMNLLLAGIMISSLFSAGTSCLKLLADPSNELPAITYWLMGSLAGATMKETLFAAVPVLLGLVPLLLLRWRLNLLTLGEEEARSLGLDTDKTRMAVISAATLLTASAVSVSGQIGWAGLVVPHLCRRLTGPDMRYLLPASCFGGALFMLLADTLARCLLSVEIPIGILTAFVGAPFFLRLLLKRGNRA